MHNRYKESDNHLVEAAKYQTGKVYLTSVLVTDVGKTLRLLAFTLLVHSLGVEKFLSIFQLIR